MNPTFLGCLPITKPRSRLQLPDDRCVARDALRIAVAQMAHAEPDFEAQEIEKLLGRFLIHLRKQRHRIVLEGPEHGRLVSVGEGLPLSSRILREVGSGSMNEPAVEDEAVAGRACHLHLVLQVVLVRSASELVGAGHDPGCTVLAGEVVQHPHDVAHDARHQARSRYLGLARIRACDRSGPHRLVIAAGRWDEPLVLVQRLRLAATANDGGQEILDTDFLAEHMVRNVQNVRQRSHLAKDAALVCEKVHFLAVAMLGFRKCSQVTRDPAVSEGGDASLALGLGLLAEALASFGKLFRCQCFLDETISVLVDISFHCPGVAGPSG